MCFLIFSFTSFSFVLKIFYYSIIRYISFYIYISICNR
nr:MAG TPA: hypothetical protein [Caudoviricetes sp.]